MHHKDRNVHSVGFRYSSETRAPQRHRFNALRWIKAATIVAALLIAARALFGV